MVKITADQIRKLKESTGAPVMRVKKVLEEFTGNEKKAEELLKKEGKSVCYRISFGRSHNFRPRCG